MPIPPRSRWARVGMVVGTLVALALVGAGGFVAGVVAMERGHPLAEKTFDRVYALRYSSVGARLFDAATDESAALTGARKSSVPVPASGADEETQRLVALGYATAAEVTNAVTGVVLHDRAKAWEGLNLYVPGHEPMASLTDMDGKVLHTWKLPVENAFPTIDRSVGSTGMNYWRRAKLLDDGNLLAIYEGIGIVKVDARSNVVWANQDHAHHDLDVGPDGRIWTLTRTAHVAPSYNPDRPILEDYVTVLSPDGKELQSWSILEAIQHSRYAPLLRKADSHGDIFHTNTITLLDGRFADKNPAFAAGNVLISSAMLDMVGVVALPRNELVWAIVGMSRFQHDPMLTDTGNLLFLNNRANNGRSEVLELDPATLQEVWGYHGDDTNDFYTHSLGAVQRLPNGNTLVTETYAARAFEVTPSGERVWQFNSPHGDAFLLDVVRLPPDLPTGWIPPAPSAP